MKSFSKRKISSELVHSRFVVLTIKFLHLCRMKDIRGVVAHSSGNHAQGVALASRLLNVKAVVVMPKNSSRIKVEATQSYGAEVVLCEDSSDDRERVAKILQSQFGYAMVPPFDDDKIIAGQGTVMMEIAQDHWFDRLSFCSCRRRRPYKRLCYCCETFLS